MKDLVEVIAKALVDHPDEVSVSEKENGRSLTVELHVAPSDMGKVIDVYKRQGDTQDNYDI